jgi:hypothetical protein
MSSGYEMMPRGHQIPMLMRMLREQPPAEAKQERGIPFQPTQVAPAPLPPQPPKMRSVLRRE